MFTILFVNSYFMSERILQQNWISKYGNKTQKNTKHNVYYAQIIIITIEK